MQKERMDHVRKHFDSEAGIFDEHVLKVVPYYREMLDALAANIPFPAGKDIRVLDLGCGTGTISALVKSRFPNAHVTCVDVSQNMLDAAAKKLAAFKDIKYELADFHSYEIKKGYDAIVASLALRHLETVEDKSAMHTKIFKALNKGGIFANADITISPDERIQSNYLKKWKEYIMKTLPEDYADKNYERYLREDRPSVLIDEIERLKKIGFSHVEIFWKYYNFATYGAIK